MPGILEKNHLIGLFKEKARAEITPSNIPNTSLTRE